jgi:hypothetical protein
LGFLGLALWLLPAVAMSQAADPRDQPKLPPATSPATTAPAPAAAAPAPAPAAASPSAAPSAPASATPPATPATAPAPTAPAAAPTPPAAPMPQGDPGYQARLRGLEEKVNELKEKVFRSKARLVLLQEAVLTGSVTGAYALIVHKNAMGSSFKLEYASYHLDGQPIYQPTDTAELEKKTEFPIYNGAIVPGSHTLSAYLVYRGASSVFSYWQGYQFKIKSSFTFHFEEGKVTQIKSVGHEKGGVTTELKDRPSIRFDVDVQKVSKGSTSILPQNGASPARTPTPEAK